MAEKIVVTGIGLTTPLGVGSQITWRKIKEGRSLLTEATLDNIEATFSSFIRSAPLKNLNGSHRIFSLALTSVQEALNDSQIDSIDIPSKNVGCSVSVSKPIISLPSFQTSSATHQLPWSSFYFPLLSPESVIQFLTRELSISGPTQNVISACATGIHSLMIASRWLQEKRCDIAIAGSVESSLHPLYLSGFLQMGTLSNFPCPFDKRRKGFMIGEGAGILILERKSDALARKAKIYAEISGTAISSDKKNPVAFDSSGESIANLLKKTLLNSKISENEVDYINLHGTGTKINDPIESKAIKKTFSKRADQISLSSTKAATGHLLGASGSVESAISCLAIQDQFVPPTLNLESPDPKCDLDYTALKGKSKKIEIALSLSFGFGGSIGAIIFQKPS